METVLVEDVSSGSDNRYSGTVEEETGTQLSFAVPGTVSRVLVDEGDRVSKGQLIATLDPAQLRSAYTVAKTALDQASDAYNRMKELHMKGSLPEINGLRRSLRLSAPVQLNRWLPSSCQIAVFMLRLQE